MKSCEVIYYCLETFKDIVVLDSWGEIGVYYNPNNVLKRGVYILTVKEKDGQNDRASNLDRSGIYRVNFCVRKITFENLFGALPKRPHAGGVVDMEFDFTKTNVIIPHSVYGYMGWISILNPLKESFENIKPLIQESYELSIEKFKKRKIT